MGRVVAVAVVVVVVVVDAVVVVVVDGESWVLSLVESLALLNDFWSNSHWGPKGSIHPMC